MNKQIEIEEIARTMCRHFGTTVCTSCDAHNTCMIHLFAADIHNAGYRKQKVGRWIKYGAIFMCIACKRCRAKKSNFCPNCGAKMEGDSDA